ncbi:hypothetical protein A1O1_07549 [Capronia coronata CBS 617.96]|uniref:Putative zinc-finger domain-containing protein n=1 Tax=Capronia coronata CBS 617.96 TaxID=1182541 RepID=W9Y2S5_9EURO|nr:uncharacterized protein A1O1_07549 [Capronia coronata CBS 617.96]EXJ83920.1 hypothetical protein A1O1_07549 [Capronia coronata CBS 617.96]
MAHPFASTPVYGGTTSYTPQRPYYPPFPPNALQQQIHTPPGLPQQPPHPPGSYQPSPSNNAPRFDANSQIRPPAPPFPPFPPPPAAFNPDLFKQFASAGLPPPPPLSFPPVPIPTTGYPQFAPSMSSSAPTPYAHHSTPGNQLDGPRYGPNEPVQQYLSDPFGGTQHSQSESREPRHRPQAYGAPSVTQKGVSHVGHSTRAGDNDLDTDLPSFGSKSDLDLLFATAQGQAEHSASGWRMGNAPSTVESSANDGAVSPYDPSRPATIQDRATGRFSASASTSQAVVPRPIVRTYDNKSPAELRQLAKGALLSLVPHNIFYRDLVKEGVHPQLLRGLYGELGIKVEPDDTKWAPELHNQPASATTTDVPPTSQQPGINPLDTDAQEAQVKSQEPQSQASTTSLRPSGLQQNEGPPLSKLPDVQTSQPASSPNLERKDRIAQLLAAKTGRPSPATPSTVASANDEPSTSISVAKPVQPADSVAFSTLPALQEAPSLPKARAQTEVVKQRMEQLRREAQSKAAMPTRDGSSAAITTTDGKTITDPENRSSQPESTTSAPRETVLEYQGSSAQSSFMIPGLFMTSSGSFAVEETTKQSAVLTSGNDTEMGGIADNEYNPHIAAAVVEPDGSPSPTVTQKRPLTLEAGDSGLQPQTKKLNMGEYTQATAAAGDAEEDSQSEGEIVEDNGADMMETAPGAAPQGFTEGDDSGLAMLPKPEMSLPSLTALQQGSASPASEGGGGRLYRAKQSEIEAMRRKIAELEQRNRLKRSKSQMDSAISSNPSTPATGRDGQHLSSPPAPQPSIPAGASASSESVQKQPPSTRPISKLTPAQLAERAAVLKADLLRQRAQRQQVLQEGLPDLNAEVQKTEDRLERARSDLARAQTEVDSYRTALEKSTRRVNELSEEIAELEKQLQEGRSGQRQYSDELQQIKLEKLAEAQEAPSEASEPLPRSDPKKNPDGPSPPAAAAVGMAHDESRARSDLSSGRMPPHATFEDSDVPEPANDAASANGHASDARPESSFTSDALQQEEPDSEESFEATTGVDALQTDAMEISPEPEYVPEIHQTMPPAFDSRQPCNDRSMDVDNDSEGSVSMSDSGSEDMEDEGDYEPADIDTSQPMQQSDEDSEEYDPEEAPVEDLTPTTGVDDENMDVYEPDAYKPAEHLPETQPGRSDDIADEPVEEGEVVSAVSPETKVDDAESGPQLTEANRLTNLTQDAPADDSQESSPILDINPPPKTHFVPYKTPLSAFKTYRFHPAYNETVKTGFRSLTYSNQIDPSRPLCPTELSGEPCRDSKCEEQHFSQLGLSDEKILVQMSSAADIKDKVLRDQFIVGLKQVIADLKSRDVKDFEEVAAALSTYRRTFFAEKEEAS